MSLIAIFASISAYAYDVYYEGIYYNYLDKYKRTVEVTGGNGYIGNVIIPSSILINNEKWSVTQIGSNAFGGCKSLGTVTIPNSVTTIGDYAFYHCSSLASLTIPDSVNTIGDNAFSGCNALASVVIPNSVTVIGDNAFCNCSSLASVNVSNSVTTIGDYAFRGCSSLASVTIPSSVTAIGYGAFAFCSSLTAINVDSLNQNYVSTEGILFDKERTCLMACPGAKTSVTIPNSVTTIGNDAFSGCSSLASVTIPNSVTVIGGYGFYYCTSLESVTIPDSVTAIADHTFTSCSSLVSLTIPNSVTTIGEYALTYCSTLDSVTCLATIPPSVEFNALDDNTLANGKLFVPEESMTAYKTTDPWSKFSNIQTVVEIEDVSVGNGVKVWNDKGSIRIEGATIPCAVFDINGREVVRTLQNSISGLPTGVYLVKVGNKTFKVAI